MKQFRETTVEGLSILLFLLLLIVQRPLSVRATPFIAQLNADESQTTCTVNVVRLNLRSGPNTQFAVVEQMSKGTSFTASERTSDGIWIFGKTLNNSGWTAAKFLSCPNKLDLLPVTTHSFQDSPSTEVTQQPTSGNDPLTLIQPLDAQLSGRLTFKWQTAMTLDKNQGFELIFWRVGEDAMTKGFALKAPTKESSVVVDLDKMATILSQLQRNTSYQWGVRLVQLHPYKPIRQLGSGHQFIFASPSNTDQTTAPSQSTPPPPKPPKPPK